MKFFAILRLLFLLFLVSNCSTVPLTGRKQFDLVPEGQMLALSESSYKDFLSQNKIASNTDQAELVSRVGQKIASSVERFMKENKMGDKVKNYHWEFNLIENSEANAWCMPGGKVVVYTGILPITQDESGLAVVMGHEIAHAVAKHGDERMSQGLAAQLGGLALQAALQNKPQQTQQLFNAAYGIGTQVGILLPYSRLQESEADRLGLIFMAQAGYDPHTAIDFWQRMNTQSGSGAPPELLSTHPSDETRIKDLQINMEEALKYYQPNLSKK
jgi:predicted Zn-dependent protease